MFAVRGVSIARTALQSLKSVSANKQAFSQQVSTLLSPLLLGITNALVEIISLKVLLGGENGHRRYQKPALCRFTDSASPRHSAVKPS